MDGEEIFGFENFPEWAQIQAIKWLDECWHEVSEKWGISRESISYSMKLKPNGNVGRVDFNTSIGTIPIRVLKPQEGVSPPV